MSYKEHDEIMQILTKEFDNVKSKRGSQVYYVYHKDICVTILRLGKNKFHNGSEYCTKENLTELLKKECLLRQERFEYYGEQEDALFERILNEYKKAKQPCNN